ncbi:MAG: hypothetical protein KBT34_10335 [Prevotella sp.]|nr:hypothetical protein [Candidatus Prevotella equi]
MKRLDFHIPIYDWDVTVVTIYNKEDKNPVDEIFKEFGIEDEDAIDNIVYERCNGGETYANAGARQALLLIYRFESTNIFHNVLNHEKRHLIDRIGNVHLIKDEKEAVAYLDGYVSEQIYSNLNKLI